MNFRVDSFEVGTELRVDDIVVLFGFADVNALLQHLPQLREIFKCRFKLIEYLSAERVSFVN